MFAAGLNWNASFLKYPELTKAYHNWNFDRIAKMGDDEVKQMLDSPKFIRNERKIRATISNAAIVLKLQDKYGSLDNYFFATNGLFSMALPSTNNQLSWNNDSIRRPNCQANEERWL